MNSPINFEIEKLLIEKDIDMPVKTTITDVVMWLYEKHEIWIDSSFDGGALCFYYVINTSTNKEHANRINSLPIRFNSPTEAYEAAIIYTLKNLI